MNKYKGRPRETRRKKKYILLVAGVSLVVILTLTPGIVKETSTPDFCVTCHVMEEQYESWFLTGMHRNISCVDCHLPNDNILNHLMWKAIDGTKDIISFYGRFFTDTIAISGHGKITVVRNCIRCHDQMVSRITVGEKNCWDCHRQVKHKFPMLGTALK